MTSYGIPNGLRRELFLKLFCGDNVSFLKTLDENSVDSIVTDPPYGLKFMNKKWDHSVPTLWFWRECFRVLKPGGHVLSFGGTRTYHRMVVNIEDAGFEIRDQIMWLYGSGFPKSHNISKGIDKKFGCERENLGPCPIKSARRPEKNQKQWNQYSSTKYDNNITKPSSDQAKHWDGFGTALKPANEPIVLARKPLSEKTIVDNVLKWGTGALNIDASRVETSGKDGRWPANVILDEIAGEILDEQSGILKNLGQHKQKASSIYGGKFEKSKSESLDRSESGGASRFFYCAKASKKERNAGLEDMPLKQASGLPMRSKDGDKKGIGIDGTKTDRLTQSQNSHPTVKPIKLMEYLIKLITPPNGVVLDPFMGSGSTGVAAKNLGFDFVGMELDKEYFEIAKKRVGKCL